MYVHVKRLSSNGSWLYCTVSTLYRSASERPQLSKKKSYEEHILYTARVYTVQYKLTETQDNRIIVLKTIKL
jgi:hypothetical protein